MKLFNSIERPLGVNSYAPERKEWIATAIGAGAGLLSSFIGGSAASKAAEEANRELRAKKARDDAYYTRRYNEDYIDTNAGQNLVRRAKQMYDRSIKKATGAKAVSGGTDASVQMAKDSANQAMGDTIANIAATDQMRKDRADAQHRMDEQNYTQQKMAIENNRAQAITNAAQQASNAMIAAGSAVDQMNAAKVDLNGGGNNSTPIEPAAKSAYHQAKIDAAKNNIGNDPIAQQINAATQPDPFKYLKQQ